MPLSPHWSEIWSRRISLLHTYSSSVTGTQVSGWKVLGVGRERDSCGGLLHPPSPPRTKVGVGDNWDSPDSRPGHTEHVRHVPGRGAIVLRVAGGPRRLVKEEGNEEGRRKGGRRGGEKGRGQLVREDLGRTGVTHKVGPDLRPKCLCVHCLGTVSPPTVLSPTAPRETGPSPWSTCSKNVNAL